ncbi:MAG: sulfotransferase domain-containing protein [Chloroflexi bacterium]|nr:sulfotransferase domain-containing protein [Chloroflexota bacterium]
MRISPRQPDFFIVGAPKAGTTSLYEYLRAHPKVFMPAAKELHYFGSDLEFRRTARLTETEYLAYFSDVPDSAIRVGEASVRYLQSTRAAAEIASYCPNAAIIVMLRNPVDTLVAMHSEYIFSGLEDIEDFREALGAEEDRRAGRRIPGATNVPQVLFYRESVRYAEQVERYLAVFGTARVHVILFDDLRGNTEAVYASTLRFLGVNEHPLVEPQVVNPHKVARSQLLRRLVADPPAPLRYAARVLSRPLRKRIYRALLDVNARPAPRQTIDPTLRRDLQSEFSDDVQRLGRLIGRDLSHWLES